MWRAEASSQAFQFFVPIGAGAGLHLPSSMFIGQPMTSGPLPISQQTNKLACRWRKCIFSFESLQDLVDHVNDFHVKLKRILGTAATGTAALQRAGLQR
ncbi:zinc finger protein GLIS2-like [Salvelinus sp. IW2-2015]|uniref:zinc finger protein GLIS2-like n=1 Tax=Salvelinus sp. IW2-2015 TaxID=2691554 RepID=UPI0038D500F0